MKHLYGDPQFDLRTLERMLREGSLSKQDYEKHLEKLPDEKANAEEVILEEGATSAKGPTFLA